MKKYILLIGISLIPFISFACSICRGNMNKARVDAYINTTILLGLLPIVMGLMLFFWIYRKYKKAI